MIQDKYKLDYEQYKTVLENTPSMLKELYINLKVKYGDNLANALWEKFIVEYAK